jgi:hypothetical protein
LICQPNEKVALPEIETVFDNETDVSLALKLITSVWDMDEFVVVFILSVVAFHSQNIWNIHYLFRQGSS